MLVDIPFNVHLFLSISLCCVLFRANRAIQMKIHFDILFELNWNCSESIKRRLLSHFVCYIFLLHKFLFSRMANCYNNNYDKFDMEKGPQFLFYFGYSFFHLCIIRTYKTHMSQFHNEIQFMRHSTSTPFIFFFYVFFMHRQKTKARMEKKEKTLF